MKAVRSFVSAMVWGLASLVPAGVYAQRAPQAQDPEQQHRRGMELRAQHRDEEARRLFEGLWTRTHDPRALARMALAEHALEQFAQAETHLVEALSHTENEWIVQNATVLDPILQQCRSAQGISILEVRCAAEGAAVFINDRLAGRPGQLLRVPPGVVTFEVRASGFQSAARTVELRPGASVHEELTLTATPTVSNNTTTATNTQTNTNQSTGNTGAANTQNHGQSSLIVTPPRTLNTGNSTLRALAWGTAGGAVAFAGVGVLGQVLGAPAAERWNSDACVNQSDVGNGTCAQDIATARTMGWLRGVGFVGAGVLAASSVVLFVVSRPSAQEPRSVAFSCAPVVGDQQGVQCAGAF